MKIFATVKSSVDAHSVEVATNEAPKTLDIKPKASGKGSEINGGELLFLALATCYCNDVYREADGKEITVHAMEVKVEGEFGERGEPAKNVSFDVKISADATSDQINELLQLTDSVAEIQNTLRIAVPVSLGKIEIL